MSVCVCVYTTSFLFIHLLMHYFDVLAVVNSAAMNIGMHVSF